MVIDPTVHSHPQVTHRDTVNVLEKLFCRTWGSLSFGRKMAFSFSFSRDSAAALNNSSELESKYFSEELKEVLRDEIWESCPTSVTDVYDSAEPVDLHDSF